MSERQDTYSNANVRRGLLDFLAGKGVQVAGGFATMLLLVRWLPVPEYALYVTVSAVASLLGTLSLLGMDRAASRYVPQAVLQASLTVLRKFVAGMAALRLTAVLLLGCALAICWRWLAPFFSLPTWAEAPQLVALTLAWGVVHAMLLFQTAVSQALMQQRCIRDATALAMVLKLAGLTGLWFVPGTALAAVAVAVSSASDALAASWLFWGTRRHLHRLAEVDTDGRRMWRADWREIVKVSLQNFAVGQLSFPTQLKPLQLVAAATLPTAGVAAFGFVMSLAANLRLMLPLYLFRSMLEPVMIGRYVAAERSAAAFAAIAMPLAKACAVVVFVMVTGLAIGGRALVDGLAGPAYAGSAWMMAVAVAGMLPASWRTLNVVVANAQGSNALLLQTSVIGALAALGCIAATLSGWGVWPLLLAEAAFSVCAVAAFRWRNAASRPMLPLQWSTLAVGAALSAALCALSAGLYRLWPPFDAVPELITATSAALILVAALFALRVLRLDELRSLWAQRSSRTRKR
jgi:pyruvyl transferase EpsO